MVVVYLVATQNSYKWGVNEKITYEVLTEESNYDKVKDNEHMIQDVLNKGKQVSIKKTVWKNLGILALCIPLALVSFWYYFIFQVS